MIFQYTSCPVCGSTDIYKDSQGFEQCHHCLNPYTTINIPKSVFKPTTPGIEQFVRGIN